MGSQKNIILRGRFDNVVYYALRGKGYMRSTPEFVNRTDASIASGFDFGKASKTCKTLRTLLAPINPCKTDKRVMHRLTGAINQFVCWMNKTVVVTNTTLNQLPYINGFQFNEQSNLSDIAIIKPKVELVAKDLLQLNLGNFVPKMRIPASSNIISIRCNIMLAGSRFNDAAITCHAAAEINIPYTDNDFHSPTISLPVRIEEGSLAIIAIALQFIVLKNGEPAILNDIKKQPCGIVWSRWN